MKTDAARPVRILVIEDDNPFARMLEDFFETRGWEVAVALGGLEGFREASRARYDVITLDINMPEVSGVETIRAMQLVGQDARIVVVSGYLTKQVAAECRAAGAAAFLAKPVEMAHLGELIEKLLAKSRAVSNHLSGVEARGERFTWGRADV
jgi:CheY-like chemotaxis protein